MFFFALSRAFDRRDWLGHAPATLLVLLLTFAGATSQIGLSVFLVGAAALACADVLARYRFGIEPGTTPAHVGLGLLLVGHSYFLAGVQVPSHPHHGVFFLPALARFHWFFANLQYGALALLSLLACILLHRRLFDQASRTSPRPG